MLSLPAYTETLGTRLTSEGYLPLPGLLPPDALTDLRRELQRLEMIATRRDFSMECMGGSPRHMTTLGGQVIAEKSSMIAELYRDTEVLRLLGRIAGTEVTPVPEPVERYVVNILHHEGDTHGAHTDDYPLALVLFTEAPSLPQHGGLLEYVPHVAELHTLDSTRARQAHHQPGDGYLLRSDTTAHRVTPLSQSGIRRVILNLAYTTPDRQSTTTPSASLLYS